MRTSKAGGSILRMLAGLVLCVFAAGFASTALVVFSPGYGTDENQLDPRYSKTLDNTAPDRNVFRLYWNYVKAAVHGDFGLSSTFNEPVSALLRDRAGITARNVARGLLGGWAAALGLSICGLIRRGHAMRSAALVSGTFLLCIPSALIALAAVLLKLSAGPAIAAVLFPRLHRYTDNLLQAAASKTHVLAARARGVAAWRVIVNHIMRTAFPEIIALAGVSISIALGASIPLEVLSDDPGIGQLAWRGALARDVQLVAGATLIISVVTMTANRLSALAVTLTRREA